MASINTNKADKIMLYLRGNGYARGGAEKLGPDIVEFLEGNGHTFVGSAKRQIEGMSTSQWNKMNTNWAAGDINIEHFFGLNPHELEDLYMRRLSKINANSHKIEPGKNTTGAAGVGGAKGGSGLIKPGYAFDGFNGIGWDTINLMQIAEDGRLDDDYIIKMKNLRTNPITDEFDQVRTSLIAGSALGSYGTSPPAVSKSAPATITTTTVVEDKDEEEEEEVVAPPVVSYEFDKDLKPTEITEIIGVSSMTVPTVEDGERKVSSKAYDGLGSDKTITVTSGLIEVVMKTLSKTQGVILDEVTVQGVTGALEYTDFAPLMEAGVKAGRIIEIIDDEGDEQQLLAAPTVKFIIDVDEGKVYIVINDQMLVASRGSDEYTFTECAVEIYDPAGVKEGITRVFLDGTEMAFGKWVAKESIHDEHFDYGFPLNGVEGLPPTCYEEYYPKDDEGAVENAPATLAGIARGEFILEGGRPIIFGKPKTYNFDISKLDDKYLQPLDLNFDITLDDDDAVIFVINYGGVLKNKTNLFPGQIDDSSKGFTELQMFVYPDDIRNVRPLNDEKVVMVQKYHRRNVGEGIESIMIDSSNLKDSVTYPIGGISYKADIYTQVRITFDSYKYKTDDGSKEVDETSMVIPDGDMIFRGLDNSNSPIEGEVTSLEDAYEGATVIVIKGKATEIYNELEQQRKSARISSKYNAINKTNDVITKTLLVEQTVATTRKDKKESIYYLIIGTGKTTKVISMDMGASK